MSLEKILALSSEGRPDSFTENGDPAADLVLAALSCARELHHVLLASAGDDDSGTDDAEPDSDDHSGHALFKKLKGQGMPDSRASKMCAAADKKVAATALADAVTVALSSLTAAVGDWVELTSYDRLAAVSLAAGSPKEPYGDVEYADPGHQADGKKRYPVNTEEHTRAAWSYINQGKNAAKYSPAHLAAVKAKIKAAAKKHGIQIGDSGEEKVAASMVALAMRNAEALVAMHHGPHTGRHAHGHMHSVVASEEHFHNNDSDHSRHDGGSSWREY